MEPNTRFDDFLIFGKASGVAQHCCFGVNWGANLVPIHHTHLIRDLIFGKMDTHYTSISKLGPQNKVLPAVTDPRVGGSRSLH